MALAGRPRYLHVLVSGEELKGGRCQLVFEQEGDVNLLKEPDYLRCVLDALLPFHTYSVVEACDYGNRRRKRPHFSVKEVWTVEKDGDGRYASHSFHLQCSDVEYVSDTLGWSVCDNTIVVGM
jgi:hypothetical protein